LRQLVSFRTLLPVGRPARSDLPPTEPSTESYAELVAWLHGPPRRSQALLAIACRVSQATLSQYTSRRARPNPDSEVALLLQLATGGQVTSLGWLTSDERAERRRRRAHAANFARAIATGRRVVITMKVGTVPACVHANDGAAGSHVARPEKAASSRADGLQRVPRASPSLPLEPAGGSVASSSTGTVDHQVGAPPERSPARAPARHARRSSDSVTPSPPEVVLQRSNEVGAPTRGR